MFIHNSLKVYGKYVSEKESVHGVTYILTFGDGTTALILERLLCKFFFKSLIFLCFYIYVKGRIALVTDSEEEEDDVYNL